MANLLLISNSTNAGEAYLEYAMPHIEAFLKRHTIKSVLFVPYAGVTISWDDYTARVRERFSEIGVSVTSIADTENSAAAVMASEAIVVGGGNTFNLLKTMQEQGIVDAIKERVSGGMPYIGWSAGSVVASPTMCTTNDMPIVEPLSFKALALVDFQINPHYTDLHPKGHAGETRDMRLAEYIEANRDMNVVGIYEGSMLHVSGDTIEIIGGKPVKIFRYGREIKVVNDTLNGQLD